MNTENLNKLIAHVAGLTEPIEDWSPCNCFRGMIAKIDGIEDDDALIKDFLGIGSSDADDLEYRHGVKDDIGHYPLNDQKRILTTALTSLRDTGAVVWEDAT